MFLLEVQGSLALKLTNQKPIMSSLESDSSCQFFAITSCALWPLDQIMGSVGCNFPPRFCFITNCYKHVYLLSIIWFRLWTHRDIKGIGKFFPIGGYRQGGYIQRVFGSFLDFSQKWTWKAQRYIVPGDVEKIKPYVI